ncbi:MAG: type III-A CRISPR-associated RAMP protein Csm5 [Hydrogenimonas sp.]|nr:type III-A CRISPR-associated RAMP protein Csm5 [Hydrogenimonas sp.]
MKQYQVTLKALTPIHIGTGEAYEPTNFVIDNGYLYEFDEMEFFKRLDAKGKQAFLDAVESKASDSLFAIHRVVKIYKKIAIEAATHKVQVIKGIQKAYDEKVGRTVQREGGRRTSVKKVFNRFQIQKTIRQPNTHRVYIPGSSLKGAISTAFQEMLFKRSQSLQRDLFENKNPTHNLFKNLSISDAIALKSYAMIGYALNKERFEDDNQGPKTIVETIYSNTKVQSSFKTKIGIRDYMLDPRNPNKKYPLDIKMVQKACNDHYLPIFRQMFSSEAEFKGKIVKEWTNEYFSDAFYEKYKDFRLNENQFLIRVGRHSQARAVTIDGMRKIGVKVSGGGPKRKPNRWENLDQETTTWLFGSNENSNENLLPFGWVVCEIA